MKIEDIERLIAAAPPGTTIQFISITIPGENGSERIVESQLADHPRPTETLPEIVERIRATHAGAALKIPEWVRLLPGISAREIKRGVEDGSIPHTTKPGGKDHGARLISPDAMLAYVRQHHSGR